jgi:predicted aspartyl protease
MEGVIDHLGRPIVSVDTPQAEFDALRCLVDTGYNGYLLLEDSLATQMRFHRIRINEQIVLGDGSIRTVHVAREQYGGSASPR